LKKKGKLIVTDVHRRFLEDFEEKMKVLGFSKTAQIVTSSLQPGPSKNPRRKILSKWAPMKARRNLLQ